MDEEMNSEKKQNKTENEIHSVLEKYGRYFKYFQSVLVAITLGGLATSIFSLSTFESATIETDSPRIESRTDSSAAALRSAVATRNQLDSLIGEVQQAQRDFRLLRTRIDSTTEDTVYLGRAALGQELDQRLSAIEKQQTRINEAITDDPAEALSTPNLRKDINELEEEVSNSEERTRQSITNLYTIISWSIGGVIVALVGVLGSAIFLTFQE